MSANGPYLFGFIDALVRVNFPQKTGNFLTVDNFGDYYTSPDGKNWTVAHSDFLGVNATWFTCAFKPGVTDSTGKVLQPGTYVLIGFDASDIGFLVLGSSTDLKHWTDEGSGGIPASEIVDVPATLGGYDTGVEKFWARLITRANSDVETPFVDWTTTSSDGKTWLAEADPDDPPRGVVFYHKNDKTGTIVIPGAFNGPGGSFAGCSVLVIPVDGDSFLVNLGGPDDQESSRRVADVAWSPVGGSKGTYVATGGAVNNVLFPGGPKIWTSTDDGNTWTVTYDREFTFGQGPSGLSTCVVGRKVTVNI